MTQPSRSHLRPNTLAMTALLSFLAGIAPLSTDAYLPSFPAIMSALGTSASTVQLTLSTFLVGFAVGQVFYGSLSDKWGRKPVLLAGLTLFNLATLGCALAQNIETLIVLRFFQALGGGAPVVLSRAIVRDLYEGQRAAQELTRMGMIMALVPALAPMLGGVLQVWLGWRSSFYVAFAGGISLLVTTALLLPETIRSRVPGHFGPATIVRDFRTLLRVPSYRVYVGLAVLTYSGVFSWLSASSYVLQGLYGLTSLQYALGFAIPVLGFIGGSIVSQRLMRWIGPERICEIGTMYIAGGGLSMLVLVALAVPSSFALLIPMAVYLFGVAHAMPNAMALAMAPFPHRAGAASSFLGICQMSGAAVIGALLGAMLGGSALPMAGAIALLGFGTLVLLRGTRRIRRTAPLPVTPSQDR